MTHNLLPDLIKNSILAEVENFNGAAFFRAPLIGYGSAHNPEFARLEGYTGYPHLLPSDLLADAQIVLCFFLPFDPSVVASNQVQPRQPSQEWAIAYVEANRLIGKITDRLIADLKVQGIKAAAEPATGNFDPKFLKSTWSHKSAAVIAGLGSFGLHQMVITDAGCAGRFGSLVMDANLPVIKPPPQERCLNFENGSCLDCVLACPVNALDEENPFDRATCWAFLLENAGRLLEIADDVQICGKCAVMGPCSLESAV